MDASDTAADVARAESALGRPVLAAAVLPGSVANLDLRLQLADDEFVIMKIGPAEELRRELWCCGRLGRDGLPVPTVLAVDLDRDPDRPFLIMALVPGAATDTPSVAADAGRAMQVVHRVELDGFGPLDVVAGRARGRYASWAESLRAETAGTAGLVAAGLLDHDLARAALATATGPLTRYDGPGVLLHRDLKRAHLFAVDDRLTAIIDWGDAGVGDPVFDLARLSMAGAAVTASYSAGHDLPAPDPRRLAAYRVAWNLAAMGYEQRAGGDWFDVYREQIAADLG